jgi:hypothetical protein
MDSADELMAERRLHAAVDDGTLTANDLRQAIDLLRDARCGLLDPGIRRSWGQRRRHLLDRLLMALDAGSGD